MIATSKGNRRMVVQKLREALAAEPFKPFTILTADGRRYPVKSREFISIAPKAERTFVVASDPECYTILDLLLVVGFEFGNGSRQRRRAG